MKRFLLAAGTLAMALASVAAPNHSGVFPDFVGSAMSPDGRYMASLIDGIIYVVDVTDSTTYVYQDALGDEYYHGNGNCFSLDGTLVGSDNIGAHAALFKDGEVSFLPSVDGTLMNSANGVTPDGKRICGGIGFSPISLDTESCMLEPVIWDSAADGGYGKPVMLPRPMTDWAGLAPQYVTALCISDDGRTIAGQMVDNFGMLHAPVVYTLGDNGEWSWRYLAPDLINPKQLVMPENPGEAPESPDPTSFMTADELSAYSDAYTEWVASGYSGEWPDPLTYLSGSGLEEYNKAKEEYDVVYEEWRKKCDAWYDTRNHVLDASTDFEFNSVRLSSNGRYYLTTLVEVVEDPMSWTGVRSANKLCLFDLEKGTRTVVESELSLNACTVDNDGLIMGCQSVMEALAPKAYVAKPGTTELIPVEEYVASINPEAGQWMVDNMTHMVMDYDYENYDIIYKEMVVTGVAQATPGFTALMSFTTNSWTDWEADPSASYYYTYYVDMSGNAGITDVKVPLNTCTVKGLRGGILELTGDVSSLRVYDMTGVNCFSAVSPASTVSTGLQSGVYVVRLTDKAGNVRSVKVAL